jgi:hypothetical protein
MVLLGMGVLLAGSPALYALSVDHYLLPRLRRLEASVPLLHRHAPA